MMPPASPAEAQTARATSKASKLSKQLKTQLEPDLLRAVPLDRALAGWGTGRPRTVVCLMWIQRTTSASQANSWTFLSHDWASSGKQEFLSLLIVYSSRAAFLACLAVSVLVGMLRGYRVLPDEG